MHDIDAAKVVWAREMTPAENEQLIKYFSNRRVWLLDPDEKPMRLTQYPGKGSKAVNSTQESAVRIKGGRAGIFPVERAWRCLCSSLF
jgi:hypothetical protein